MGLVLLCLLVLSLALFVPKGMFASALTILLLSVIAAAVLSLVAVATEFYLMEVSTVSELGKRWKSFMPVSLL